MSQVISLRQLQRQLFERIAAGPREEWEADRGDVAHLVVGDELGTGDARIDIYARMYRARLTSALAALFPTVASELKEEFAEMARGYVAVHPSRQASLRHAGASLARFLAASPWAAHRPDLVDLARVDAAGLDAFDASDEPLLSRWELVAQAPDELPWLRLRLVQAHAVLRLEHSSVDRYGEPRWHDPQEWGADEGSPREPMLLVWRKGAQVLHRAVGSHEAEALELARGGVLLGVLCEHLCDRLGEDRATQAALDLVSRWMADELLVRVREAQAAACDHGGGSGRPAQRQ